jgi:putative spermidine/putrescine transport system permease protein
MRKLGRALATLYMALFLGFMLAPLFFILVNSFNDAAFSVFPPRGLSLRWYYNLFTVTDFWIALRNSLIIAAVSCVLALLLGTALALAVTRGGWRRPAFVQSLFMTPLMVPRILIGVAVFMAAIRVGLYPSLTSTILAHTILLVPYVTSILVANLAQVQRVQEEAAMDLGANRWQTFWLATLPQISKGALVALVFAFIVSFDEFDIALFLSRSDNMTLPVRMYLYMQEQENPTMASMSALLLVVTALAVILFMRMSKGTNLLNLAPKRA